MFFILSPTCIKKSKRKQVININFSTEYEFWVQLNEQQSGWEIRKLYNNKPLRHQKFGRQKMRCLNGWKRIPILLLISLMLIYFSAWEGCAKPHLRGTWYCFSVGGDDTGEHNARCIKNKQQRDYLCERQGDNPKSTKRLPENDQCLSNIRYFKACATRKNAYHRNKCSNGIW